MANRSLAMELWDFMRIRKAWWLAPVVVSLVLTGILIIAGHSSAISPFIYMLF